MSESDQSSRELQATLARLEVFGVRLGLETTNRLLSALGSPQADLRCVLIAGTNGKGSTAALLASMGTAVGYRTGLYTSPHLESVEERLRIDGRSIHPEELHRISTAVIDISEARLGYLPTYFEALTAAAYYWFAEQAVDLAVVEVGLGGRLDATNGADPVLSLITEIGLEHRQYLGDTLGEIAREKAGILRRGRPAVAWVGRAEARAAIQAVATEVGAELGWANDMANIRSWRAQGIEGQQVEIETAAGLRQFDLRLVGRHQRENLALALVAVDTLTRLGMDRFRSEALADGPRQARWPGRLEWVEITGHRPVLLDVAHNPDGARILERALDDFDGPFTLMFGALSDKEVDKFLPGLADRANRVVLTSPASSRAVPPQELAPLVTSRPVIVEPDRRRALTTALADGGEFVLVCGSVYLVGEIRLELRRRFGVPPAASDRLFGE